MTELNPVANVEAQSHSIGAVRWNLPEETVQVHSSAPSGPFKNSKSTSSRSQVNSKTLFSLSSGQDVFLIWGGPQKYYKGDRSLVGVHKDAAWRSLAPKGSIRVLQWVCGLTGVCKVYFEVFLRELGNVEVWKGTLESMWCHRCP